MRLSIYTKPAFTNKALNQARRETLLNQATDHLRIKLALFRGSLWCRLWSVLLRLRDTRKLAQGVIRQRRKGEVGHGCDTPRRVARQEQRCDKTRRCDVKAEEKLQEFHKSKRGRSSNLQPEPNYINLYRVFLCRQ
jgi:hypothetical protein